LLTFNEQYDISNGIFLAFKNNVKQRQLSVGHGSTVRERYQKIFPTKYETFTKENFIITCLWICFKKSPSSYDSFLDILKELNFTTDVLPFKNSIINYKHFLQQDIAYLQSINGRGTVHSIFNEYINNKIKFYTLWFYIKYSNNLEYNFNYIQNISINKIKVLLLYITFTESSMQTVTQLFNESILGSL
jgi:hypothetical protein